jgi:hypothetical protein
MPGNSNPTPQTNVFVSNHTIVQSRLDDGLIETIEDNHQEFLQFRARILSWFRCFWRN